MNNIDNGNRLTKASISRYLSWALDASTDVLRILPLAGKMHRNLLVKVLLSSKEHNFVIRSMPCTENFGFARKISPYNFEVEFTALKELEKIALPTPKVWGLDMTGKFFGTPAFIMEYIEGPTLLEVAESNTEEVINRFAVTILEMNQITTAQIPNVVVYSGMPENAPADSLGWLENQTKHIDVPDFFMNGFKVLEKEYPCNRPVKAFGNGDLGPQNFIYTLNGSIVTLDWEYVGFNDPLAEIMLLHVWPKDNPFLKKYPLDRIYCEMAGIDIKILRWYELYSALEGWIYAVNDQDKARMCIHEQRVQALLL